ncbi:histidinol-phosphate transaminase [Streptomyces sp. V3I7]|uniref:histidinol-phosphate transaminase n=1 Tax=Streptomyces sp. V3I7 TaxID=3042278 RepID=UPI002781DCBE|nr:histidinol-phosphate transaminase [Streptomyces sp. V3I7]MDQ0992755.1 histidinol-phosphate aminotransferase [Streptomyces sp. V3I7]
MTFRTPGELHCTTAGQPSLRLRAALDDVPAYVPGPAAATGTAAGWKLSSNENPFPPLPGVLEAVTTASEQLNRYPDMACGALTDELATRLNVPAGHIAVGTGSSGLLQQLLHITAEPGDEVVYPWRSFESYRIVTRLTGARPIQVPLTHDEAHDLDAMARAITDRTRLVLVCTPNNPTGRALHHGELERFLDRVPADVLVAVDEAYAEFVRDPHCADALALYRHRPNLVVLRTFSKAYGLAGLRVGYAVAHPPVITALRKAAVPFGVSTVAHDAAIASLRREDELMARVERLVAERERVRAALLEQGWTVCDSQANFLWLRPGEHTSAFAAACQRAGVSVRPYGTEGVRITIGEPQANDIILTTAEAFHRGHFRKAVS